jgi:hypothetical protein
MDDIERRRLAGKVSRFILGYLAFAAAMQSRKPRKPEPTLREQWRAFFSAEAEKRRDAEAVTALKILGWSAAVISIAVVLGVIFDKRPPAPRMVKYTGCELSGAVDRCAEVMRMPGIENSLPSVEIGKPPSRDAQVKAIEVQDDWHRSMLTREEADKREAEDRAYIREQQRRRGIKD